MKKNLLILISCILFVSCASNIEEGAQSSEYWYEKMLIAVANNNLDRADNYYNSLQSEHIASPLIKEALLLLSKAHMDNGEHLLAGFYANEYRVRFANEQNIDYTSFLAIESTYYAFNSYSKNQGFIKDNIGEIEAFVALNPNNKYLPYIRHILTSFRLAQLEINNEIIRIYNLQDKDAAVAKYQEYNENLGLQGIEFDESHIPWYVKMFSW